MCIGLAARVVLGTRTALRTPWSRPTKTESQVQRPRKGHNVVSVC